VCVIIYDENQQQRQKLEQLLYETGVPTEIYSFDEPEQVLDHVRSEMVDAAFISMEDTYGRGFFLLKELRRMEREMNLIAVADECRYGMELMKARISGYIIGEPTQENILEELRNLRYS